MSRREPDPLHKYGDLRAAAAAVKGGGPGAHGVGISDDALLAPLGLDDTDALHAARAVARHTMLNRGCLGPACPSAQHAAHRAWRDTALMALGLIGEPNTSHLGPWGNRRGDLRPWKQPNGWGGRRPARRDRPTTTEGST